jgi:hypothetical protein
MSLLLDKTGHFIAGTTMKVVELVMANGSWLESGGDAFSVPPLKHEPNPFDPGLLLGS